MSRRQTNRGFSIPETLIGIFVVALVLTALFNMIPTTVLANRHGSQRIQADNVAQSVLAEVRSLPFQSLGLGTVEQRATVKVDNVEFHPKVMVVAPPQGDPSRLKVIRVEVSWLMRDRERSVTHELWLHKIVEQ